MPRRFINEEDKKENGERWLLTYSDLITLLLALFIIMYGMSSENTGKLAEMSEALSQAFNGSAVSAVQADTDAAAIGKDGVSGVNVSSDPLQDVYDQLSSYVKLEGLEEEINMIKSDHSISIRLRDSLLFKGNSAELNPGSMKTLEKVSSVITQVYKQVNHITITGNTADLGHRDRVNEADSWQLSVDRAVKVLNVLTDKGLTSDKLSIEGNSHYNPVASNDTPEGRAANRRVEITITDGFN